MLYESGEGIVEGSSVEGSSVEGSSVKILESLKVCGIKYKKLL
jgi:hypothetical protein